MDRPPRYVYLVKNDLNETTAFLCPYRVYQHINQIYSQNPAKYKLSKDFIDMQSNLEKHGEIEMFSGTTVFRYPLAN